MTLHAALASARAAKQQAQDIVASMDAIIQYLSTQAPDPEGAPSKRDDGRLTEAGIDALYADFAAGQLSHVELMRKYDISMSGVVKRKALWKRGLR